MITKSENVNITEWPAATTWFDEDIIFSSIYRKGAMRSLEETKFTTGQFDRSLIPVKCLTMKLMPKHGLKNISNK